MEDTRAMARKSTTDSFGVTTETEDTAFFSDPSTEASAGAAPTAAPKTYVVLHGGVGPWWQGQTITDEHLAQGHNTQRLLDLGAIAEVGSEAAYQAGRDGLAGVTPEGLPVSEPVAPPPAPEQPAVTVAQDTTPVTEGNATGF